MEYVNTSRGKIGVEKRPDGYIRLYGALSNTYLGEIPPADKNVIGRIESFLQVINDKDL